ncbi:MAG: MarR family transcriptional regulator [Euryarchaeota archaeon]|nr:MarR family transcriptional regulator [Euryarchaeota archaeon]
MPTILRSSLERRILEHALDHYPVTAEELARALHVSEGRVMVELRRMESRGLVELDLLPDKVFVRPLAVIPPGRAPGRNRGERRGSDGGREGRKEGGDDPAYR